EALDAVALVGLVGRHQHDRHRGITRVQLAPCGHLLAARGAVQRPERQHERLSRVLALHLRERRGTERAQPGGRGAKRGRARDEHRGDAESRLHGSATTRSGCSREFHSTRNVSPCTSTLGWSFMPAVSARSISRHVLPASSERIARRCDSVPSNSFHAIATRLPETARSACSAVSPPMRRCPSTRPSTRRPYCTPSFPGAPVNHTACNVPESSRAIEGPWCGQPSICQSSCVARVKALTLPSSPSRAIAWSRTPPSNTWRQSAVTV